MAETNVTHVEVFQGKDEQWYWRAKAANGEIVAMSEGYTRYDHAVEAGSAVFPNAVSSVEESEDEDALQGEAEQSVSDE